MLFRVLVASALLWGRVGAATSTCGELRDAFVGAECCTAADETPVPFGDALSPPSLGSPPPPALSPPPPMPAGPAPPPMAIPTNYTGCDITIAGGGAGGIYSAWRLVKDVGVAGSSICIFEADTRLGGRIYSIRGLGPLGDTVLDMGGYRTFDTISPRTQYLITERLGLTLGCYDPVSCLGKVIVDADGNRIGFVTFVEAMLSEIQEAGVRFFFGHAMSSMARNGENYNVYLAGLPFPVAAQRVILTMPQYPLQMILRDSPSIGVSQELHQAIHSLQPVHAVKFYLYYEDAWWITKLGLEEGGFTAEGNAVSPPLEGRYHDGDIKCNADKTSCHGWLQTQYFWDFSGRTQNYFARFQKSRDQPVTMMTEIADGAIAMADVHAKVLEYHGLSADEVPAPLEGALVTWNLATPFANTGWHYWTDATKVATLQSFLSDQRIHLVNEAYSPTPSWAEGAILMADEMIEDLFGIPPPHDPVDYLARNYLSETWADAPASAGFPDICLNTCIRPETGLPFPAFVNNGGCNDGGPGATITQVCEYGTDCGDCGPRSAAGGPNGGLAEDPACFLGSSLLLLADGTRIPLSEAKVGMQVKSSLGVGTISEVLKHPINDYVRRFRLPTEHGHLVGTLDHPVYLNGQWLEVGEAYRNGQLPKVQVEYEIVDYFYNLEVDGSAAEGESHHAYDVNGVTVSGLGDNPRLNALYQRQNAFKPAHHIAKAGPTGVSDSTLEARAITSGASTVRISSAPVLDLNNPPHNLKRCPAWDYIADGSQTCGSKVQWWVNSFRYTPERAMLSVSQRYAACASCRPADADADAPLAMRQAYGLANKRRMNECTVAALCPSASPSPPPDEGCDDALCGGDEEPCDDALCGGDEEPCDAYLCGDEVEACDEYLCGDGADDDCDEYLCGDDEEGCDSILCSPEPPSPPPLVDGSVFTVSFSFTTSLNIDEVDSQAISTSVRNGFIAKGVTPTSVVTTLTPGSTVINTKATFVSEADANIGKVYFDELAASGAVGIETALNVPVTEVGDVSDVSAGDISPPVDVSPPPATETAPPPPPIGTAPSPPVADGGVSLLVPILVPLLVVGLLAILILIGVMYFMKNKKGKHGVKTAGPTKPADDYKSADAPSTSADAGARVASSV